MAVILNKNSFWLHLQLTAFCIKNNPRENRFFAASGRLADGKGTHNVKILAENYTKKQLCRKHARGQTVRKARALTAICASGCKACSPRPTATELWKRRSNPPLAGSFRFMENTLNNFCQGTFLIHNRLLPRTNGVKSLVLSHLCSVLHTWRGVFILVLTHKDKTLLSIIRKILKGKATSLLEYVKG